MSFLHRILCVRVRYLVWKPGGQMLTPLAGEKASHEIDSRRCIFPLLFPSQSCTMQEVGRSMINAVLKGYAVRTLEISDIKRLAVA